MDNLVAGRRIHRVAGRRDFYAAVANEVTPQRHLDLTREELAWLHRVAFDRDIVGTDQQACDAIVMQKGFAWAREKIDARRNAIGNGKLRGDQQ